MNDTPLSLLDRVRRQPNEDSWEQLVQLYTPLLKRWLARYQFQDSDAQDVVQEVLMAVVRELPRFEHQGQVGAFRSWLRTVLVHRVKDFWKTRGRAARATGTAEVLEKLAQLEDPGSSLSQLWRREHDQHVLRQLLHAVGPRFTSTTREAFRRLMLQGESPAEVAAALGISTNAVFIAKSRVVRELRREARGLL